MKKFTLYVKGLGGYLQDVYRIARSNFSNPHSYTKFLLIEKIRRLTDARVFIEAGTFRGATAYRCSKTFERVYTIELDTKLAENAKRFLANRENVNVIQGDAMKELPNLLHDEKIESALLFLDGHFSHGVTACGDLPEPAVEELRELSKYRKKIRAIVIDDFRSFGTEDGFPTKSELLKSAEEYFGQNGYHITVHLDQVVIMRAG